MATPAERQPILPEQAEEVEAGVITGERVEVKEFGRTVSTDPYMFGKTNFFIKQSRPYVGNRTLTEYVYIKWLHWLYIPVFISSLFVLFNENFAYVMLGVNLVILAIYLQNMYVNVYTMRYVLKQPSFPDNQLKRANTFFEITQEEFAATYAVSHRAGLCQVLHARGRVKIQVFRHSTMQVMKYCVIISTVCFISALFLVVYCLVWGILKTSEAQLQDNN